MIPNSSPRTHFNLRARERFEPFKRASTRGETNSSGLPRLPATPYPRMFEFGIQELGHIHEAVDQSLEAEASGVSVRWLASPPLLLLFPTRALFCPVPSSVP